MQGNTEGIEKTSTKLCMRGTTRGGRTETGKDRERKRESVCVCETHSNADERDVHYTNQYSSDKMQ